MCAVDRGKEPIQETGALPGFVNDAVHQLAQVRVDARRVRVLDRPGGQI